MSNGTRPSPPSNNSTGCCIGLVVIVGLSIFAVIAFFTYFIPKAVDSIPDTPEKLRDHTVHLHQPELDSQDATSLGESISREEFVGLFLWDRNTELARSAFIDAADGLAVDWVLKLSSLREKKSNPNEDKPSRIEASFSLPYSVRYDSNRRSTSKTINVEFEQSDTNDLINFREGDWLRVTGTLKLQSQRNDFTIANPKAHPLTDAKDSEDTQSQDSEKE